MAYNFKSLADVEVVAEPSESANVLIEENGVVKKAPKTAVGGVSGAAGTGSALFICEDELEGTVTVSDNFYNEVMDKIINNLIGLNMFVYRRDSYGIDCSRPDRIID